ncbi:MAG TPA: 2-oxo acid dehydrogenase subunit E2 [Bacilli bacterium]|nr:2-oxo acid dehydrogenase subunit E2 [Bacilli bacterium]HPZ24164.1 2-oxo acid dehydrogenase subunit E2 [Bacilli bacterium]
MSILDRKDGKRVRDIHGFQNILIDFKPNRCDSVVYMNDTIDVTNFVKYMDKLKKKEEGLTYYHGIVDIMAKTVYSRPYLNRFIAGRSMYMHNEVSLASTIKAEFEDKSVECLMVIHVGENDTLLDISKQTKDKVDKIRNRKSGDIDSTADKIGLLPKVLRIPIIGLLKFLDAHGWLPQSLVGDNIYYSSAILSNLGTFKVGGIYHNLTNFGTSSMLITFGEIKKEENGDRYFMEMGATLDERIADGFYFCKALKLIEYMFSHPEVMMEPAGKKVSIPKK